MGVAEPSALAHRGRKLKGTAGLEMSDKHERRDDARRIVILTGAGISAESGVPTFRDAGGLWEGHRIEEVATPGAFLRNPRLVHRFYNLRRADLAERQPNAAHQAISRLQACRRQEAVRGSVSIRNFYGPPVFQSICHGDISQ